MKQATVDLSSGVLLTVAAYNKDFQHADFGLSVLELGRGKRDTDGQTDGRTDAVAHFIVPPSLWGRGTIKLDQLNI